MNFLKAPCAKYNFGTRSASAASHSPAVNASCLQRNTRSEDIKEKEMSEAIALDWTAIVVVALAVIPLASPHTRDLLAEHSTTVGSFGAGLTISYVFVHLFSVG